MSCANTPSLLTGSSLASSPNSARSNSVTSGASVAPPAPSLMAAASSTTSSLSRRRRESPCPRDHARHERTRCCIAMAGAWRLPVGCLTVVKGWVARPARAERTRPRVRPESQRPRGTRPRARPGRRSLSSLGRRAGRECFGDISIARTLGADCPCGLDRRLRRLGSA
jgi:hypothetical protein